MSATENTPTSEELAEMDRDELVKLGTNLDGVEILHREPASPSRAPAPRSAPRPRGHLLVHLAGIRAGVPDRLPVQPLGIRDAEPAELLAVLVQHAAAGHHLRPFDPSIGPGVVAITKRFIPAEIVVQDRHDGGSSEVDKKTTVALLGDALETRRCRAGR